VFEGWCVGWWVLGCGVECVGSHVCVCVCMCVCVHVCVCVLCVAMHIYKVLLSNVQHFIFLSATIFQEIDIHTKHVSTYTS